MKNQIKKYSSTKLLWIPVQELAKLHLASIPQLILPKHYLSAKFQIFREKTSDVKDHMIF